MAVVVNERDALLQASAQRVVDVTLPGNVTPSALKGIELLAPATVFHVAGDGSSSPTAITLTVKLSGLPETTPVTWSVSSGTATLTGTGSSRTLAGAAMTTSSVLVSASVTVDGMTYSDTLGFIKVSDGVNGNAGSRGSISTARAITGSSWSNTEALAAIQAAGGTALVATDTVTLYNVSTEYSEMRRYNGTAWVPVGAVMPGSTLMKRSILTEQLLVTGQGIALNSDPNTMDASAWLGSNLTIQADTDAPNGATYLRCAGLGTTVLSRKFAIDPTRNYRVRTWAKQISGSSTSLLLVAFYDASGNLIQGVDAHEGWLNFSTYHYYGLYDQAPGASWAEYSTSFGEDEVKKIPANARFAAIGMVSNYTGTGVQGLCGLMCHLKTTGEMVVDGSIDAVKLNTRGLTVQDNEGNVVIGGGNAVTQPFIGRRVNLSVTDAIAVGSSNNGVYMGSAGLFGRKGGQTTFSIDLSGNAMFAGALQGATGEFAGVLAAGVLNLAGFDAMVYEFAVPGIYYFTIPSMKSGWTSMNVRAVQQAAGGGGGGGYYSWQPNSDPSAGGGGGGAGTRISVELVAVEAGQLIIIEVGSGGLGGNGSNHWGDQFNQSNPAQDGQDGGATRVTYQGTTYTANGGVRGRGGSATLAAEGGGNSTSPAYNVPGGPWGGQNGGSLLGDNSETVAPGGGGGSSFYGPGGVPNGDGGGFGAGGGGAPGNATNGGKGRGGYVRLEIYDPTTVVLNNRYTNLVQWLDSIGHGTVPGGAR